MNESKELLVDRRDIALFCHISRKTVCAHAVRPMFPKAVDVKQRKYYYKLSEVLKYFDWRHRFSGRRRTLPLVVGQCKHCGKQISWYGKYKKIYCSKACRHAHSEKNRFYCNKCGKRLAVRTRTQLCSLCFGNRKKEPNKTCPICGKRFYDYGKNNRLYCSIWCRSKSIQMRNAIIQRKTCTACGRDLPISDFAFSVKAANRRQARCRECERVRRGKYPRYKESPESKIRAREYSHKRKALLRKLPSEPIGVFFSQTNCYYCGAKLSKDNANIEHIVPISRGGSNLAYNKVWSCCTCNNKKAAKHPNNFIKGQLVLTFDEYKA